MMKATMLGTPPALLLGNETDEECRMHRKRKDEEQRQLRRRGRSIGATAGKKKGTSGNKKLAVSHGSDDTFL